MDALRAMAEVLVNDPEEKAFIRTASLRFIKDPAEMKRRRLLGLRRCRCALACLGALMLEGGRVCGVAPMRMPSACARCVRWARHM